jgi:hypothetical protein
MGVETRLFGGQDRMVVLHFTFRDEYILKAYGLKEDVCAAAGFR